MSSYPKQNNTTWLTDGGVLFLLFLTAMVFFPLKGVTPSPDSSLYLKNAVRLYNDLSFENLLIRRALYPLMLSLSFHVLGNSIESAFIVVRLFFAGNLLLGYAVGRTLFNRSTGIAFALLLLTSFVINRWSSYLLLDDIIPVFVFLFLLVLYKAFDACSRPLFGFAGLILGATFLIKGVFAIFFMFLPVLALVIGEFRTRRYLRHLLLLYLIAFYVISPWLFYCIWERDFYVLFGVMFDFREIQSSAGVLPTATAFSLTDFLTDQFRDFLTFLDVYIHQTFALSYLFGIGLVYGLGSLFFKKRRRPFVFLFAVILLFSPVIYIGMKSGGANFRKGQFFILYFVLYLMLSFCIADISCRISSLFGDAGKRKAFPLIFLCFLLPCLYFQVFVGAKPDKSERFLTLIQQDKITGFYGFSFWQGEFNARNGWAGDTTREAAQWMKAHIPAGETVLCQWYVMHMLAYLTENRYDMQYVEYTWYHEDESKTPLFVWPRYRYKVMEGNSLVAIYEDNLLAQVNGERIRYLIVTQRRNFLSLYMSAHPDFELVQSVTHGGQNIKIYKAKRFPVRPLPEFTVKFDRDIYRLFAHAAKESPPTFDYLTTELKQILNWGDEQLETFSRLVRASDRKGFARTYDVVKARTVY